MRRLSLLALAFLLSVPPVFPSATSSPDHIPIGIDSTKKKTKKPKATPKREHPAGASAICRDGTYSYSRSRRGTCSHHGGVAQWL